MGYSFVHFGSWSLDFSQEGSCDRHGNTCFQIFSSSSSGFWSRHNRVFYDVNADFRLDQTSDTDPVHLSGALRSLRTYELCLWFLWFQRECWLWGWRTAWWADGLVGLVLRIVRRKSDVEMAAYSLLDCAMASLRVPVFDAMAMSVITSGDFFLCLTLHVWFFSSRSFVDSKSCQRCQVFFVSPAFLEPGDKLWQIMAEIGNGNNMGTYFSGHKSETFFVARITIPWTGYFLDDMRFRSRGALHEECIPAKSLTYVSLQIVRLLWKSVYVFSGESVQEILQASHCWTSILASLGWFCQISNVPRSCKAIISTSNSCRCGFLTCMGDLPLTPLLPRKKNAR